MGRHDDGRPFYAMRLIEDDTLADAIKSLSRQACPQRRPSGASARLA